MVLQVVVAAGNGKGYGVQLVHTIRSVLKGEQLVKGAGAETDVILLDPGL